MAKTPIVQFVMGRSTRAFGIDDKMADAMHELARSPFPALPVVDRDGRVAGVLSEKDCLRTVCQWSYEGISGGTVGDHMSALDVRITPEMDLLTAARAFLECNFSYLPVTEDDRLVGFIHRHEVLKGIDRWATAIDRERELRLKTTSGHDRPSAIQHMQKIAASHTREQLAQLFKKR
ncbi:MAG: CBS domain-containing protein [Thermoanaerobaculales bacterium]|nr:CBS domain-containing protein [Thermoanaerobaculales bacterium]